MFLAQDAGSGSGRAPHDDFWYLPVGGMSVSGVRVSSSTALAVSTLYACAQVLGQTAAVVPLVLYRRTDKGGKDRATDHPLFKLLHRQPNRWQTSFQFRQMMQWHLSLRYNAYAEKQFDRRGDISGLVPCHPDRVKVERFDAGGGMVDFRYKVTDAKGVERTLVREEMFHVRGLSSDGIEGFSPLDVQADSIGEAIAAQRYGASRMRNDARPPGVIEWAGHFQTDTDRDKFRVGWQRAQTGTNSGKTAVLERGMSYKELGIKNTELQYIELRKLKATDICSIWRMPPHKVGILDRATFTNIEQQGLEFVTDTMLPWYVNWEQELSLQLLMEDELEEYFFEHLVDGLLRGDSKARAEYYSKGILDGWMTRNEVRIRENLNPLQGLDKPLEPMNMRKAGEQPKDENADTGAEPGDGSLPAEEDSASARRLRALNAAAIERVVRKESEMVRRAFLDRAPDSTLVDAYARHESFVAGVMAVPDDVAAAYCASQLQFASNAKETIVQDFESFTRTQLERLVLDAQAPKGD